MTSGVTYFEEPRAARWLFGSSKAASIWLVLRVWLGWEWIHAGWGKVFGGNITWRFWNWGDEAYSLTGAGNVGWIRSGERLAADGTVTQVGIGDNVAGFAAGGIASAQGPHPDVAFSWYVNFLEWVRDTAHPVIGPLVAFGELLIGIALVVGAFVGIMAFLGALLNFSFVFAGSAGVNPAMIAASIVLILAWRNAGYLGMDRYLLKGLGTPWQPGTMFRRFKRRHDMPTAA